MYHQCFPPPLKSRERAGGVCCIPTQQYDDDYCAASRSSFLSVGRRLIRPYLLAGGRCIPDLPLPASYNKNTRERSVTHAQLAKGLVSTNFSIPQPNVFHVHFFFKYIDVGKQPCGFVHVSELCVFIYWYTAVQYSSQCSSYDSSMRVVAVCIHANMLAVHWTKC